MKSIGASLHSPNPFSRLDGLGKGLAQGLAGGICEALAGPMFWVYWSIV